jgi:putative ABC transport system substrate-binding protein
MSRRQFIILIVGFGILAAPVAAQTQEQKIPVIGFLGQSTPTAESQRVVAFAGRLRELGWIEGRSVAIDYRWAEGRSERFAEIAAEFVRSKVDVIVTSGTSNVIAAMQATSIIPIVFAVAGDPVGNDLVASLARPGGNVTGLSTLATDLAGKRLELLREALPALRRVAIMGNVDNSLSVLEMREIRTAAARFGIESIDLEIRQAADIALAFEAGKGKAEALYVVADPLTNTNRTRIHAFAMNSRWPTIYNAREHVEAGGLMSYGPNFPDLYRRAAEFVHKILRGTKPADLPVEQPTRFDLVVNLTTARILAITLPPSLLARADEVIE